MRAVVIARPGGPEVLELRDVPTPEPAKHEVRVRVRATALNRADLLQRMGRYPAPVGVPADIPGLELAGVVDSLGPGVSRWAVGDPVFGLVGGGSYAEFAVAHERTLARIPDGMDFLQAAAVPEAFITAHDALFRLGGLRSGERVLVSAVGSGVGLAALQLVRSVNGVALGTSRTAEKLTRAREHGLERGYSPQDQGTIDLLIDFIGAPQLTENLAALAPLGRMVVVGLLGGGKGEIDLGVVLTKRLTIVGTTLRARPLEEKISVTRTFEREVVPLLARGVLKPVVDRVLSIDKVREAHEVMGRNENFGKIVLAF